MKQICKQPIQILGGVPVDLSPSVIETSVTSLRSSACTGSGNASTVQITLHTSQWRNVSC